MAKFYQCLPVPTIWGVSLSINDAMCVSRKDDKLFQRRNVAPRKASSHRKELSARNHCLIREPCEKPGDEG